MLKVGSSDVALGARMKGDKVTGIVCKGACVGMDATRREVVVPEFESLLTSILSRHEASCSKADGRKGNGESQSTEWEEEWMYSQELRTSDWSGEPNDSSQLTKLDFSNLGEHAGS